MNRFYIPIDRSDITGTLIWLAHVSLHQIVGNLPSYGAAGKFPATYWKQTEQRE